MKYYELAPLVQGQSIHFEPSQLVVDLTKFSNSKSVRNDQEFQRAVSKDTYFWISGGGSIVLQDRYVFLVQRSLDAKINPGKFSFFTGRADGNDEWNNPDLLVRELFEELIIYDEQKIYYPRISNHQEVVDKVYSSHHKFDDTSDFKSLPLQGIETQTTMTSVIFEGRKEERSLSLCISSQTRDINHLRFFGSELDQSTVLARDAESSLEERVPRKVFLYDLKTDKASLASSSNRDWRTVDEESKSELLKFGISLLKESLEI